MNALTLNRLTDSKQRASQMHEESRLKGIFNKIMTLMCKLKPAEVRCASYHEIQERIRSNRLQHERMGFPYSF